MLYFSHFQEGQAVDVLRFVSCPCKFIFTPVFLLKIGQNCFVETNVTQNRPLKHSFALILVFQSEVKMSQFCSFIHSYYILKNCYTQTFSYLNFRNLEYVHSCSELQLRFKILTEYKTISQSFCIAQGQFKPKIKFSSSGVL